MGISDTKQVKPPRALDTGYGESNLRQAMQYLTRRVRDLRISKDDWEIDVPSQITHIVKPIRALEQEMYNK